MGELRIDPTDGRAWFNGAELSLSRTEFTVLCVLAEAEGRVLSRSELARRAGLEGRSARRADSVISALRRALGPHALRTVRRRGWSLDVDPF